jgi:hypothetical protein
MQRGQQQPQKEDEAEEVEEQIPDIILRRCQELISFGKPELMQCAQNKKAAYTVTKHIINSNSNNNSNNNNNTNSDNDNTEFGNDELSIAIEEQLTKFLQETSAYFMQNILLQILYFTLHSVQFNKCFALLFLFCLSFFNFNIYLYCIDFDFRTAMFGLRHRICQEQRRKFNDQTHDLQQQIMFIWLPRIRNRLRSQIIHPQRIRNIGFVDHFLLRVH